MHAHISMGVWLFNNGRDFVHMREEICFLISPEGRAWGRDLLGKKFFYIAWVIFLYCPKRFFRLYEGRYLYYCKDESFHITCWGTFWSIIQETSQTWINVFLYMLYYHKNWYWIQISRRACIQYTGGHNIEVPMQSGWVGLEGGDVNYLKRTEVWPIINDIILGVFSWNK